MQIQLPESSSSALTLSLPDPEGDRPTSLLDQLVSMGLVEDADLTRLRLISRQLAAVGEPASLLDRLIDDQLLTHDQARRLAEGLGKVTPTCFRCTRHNAFDQASFTGAFFCQHCGLRVSLVDGTAGFDDALFPNPPARVLDKIVETLAVAGGRIGPDQIETLKLRRLQTVPRPSLFTLLEREELLSLKRLLKMRTRAQLLYRERVPFWRELQCDYELACFLSRMRLVSSRQLEWALQAQLQGTMRGEYLSLRERLRVRGLLTDRQLQQFLPSRFDASTQESDMLAQFGQPFLTEEVEEAALPDWEDSLAELAEELHSESSISPILPYDQIERRES